MKNEKVTKALEMLEQGVRETFTAENFVKYLDTVSKFTKYSFNNQVMIAMQCPNATRVAGFQSWKNNFKRSVKKGEKGIMIFAPRHHKTTVEKEDNDGNKIEEQVAWTSFFPVYVFDISQTEGQDLPEICKTLCGGVDGFDQLKGALGRISGVPIEYKSIKGRAYGYYDTVGNKIVIKDGLPEAQQIKTTLHEITHSRLHGEDGVQKDADKNMKEVQAEAVAYVVCKYLGIDTDGYSFEYVASWSNGKDAKELKESLGVISTTAKEIIEDIEKEVA